MPVFGPAAQKKGPKFFFSFVTFNIFVFNLTQFTILSHKKQLNDVFTNFYQSVFKHLKEKMIEFKDDIKRYYERINR